jgi:hypothetical protein
MKKIIVLMVAFFISMSVLQVMPVSATPTGNDKLDFVQTYKFLNDYLVINKDKTMIFNKEKAISNGFNKDYVDSFDKDVKNLNEMISSKKIRETTKSDTSDMKVSTNNVITPFSDAPGGGGGGTYQPGNYYYVGNKYNSKEQKLICDIIMFGAGFSKVKALKYVLTVTGALQIFDSYTSNTTPYARSYMKPPVTVGVYVVFYYRYDYYYNSAFTQFSNTVYYTDYASPVN